MSAHSPVGRRSQVNAAVTAESGSICRRRKADEVVVRRTNGEHNLHRSRTCEKKREQDEDAPTLDLLFLPAELAEVRSGKTQRV